MEFKVRWSEFDALFDTCELWKNLRNVDKLHDYLSLIGLNNEIPKGHQKSKSEPIFLWDLILSHRVLTKNATSQSKKIFKKIFKEGGILQPYHQDSAQIRVYPEPRLSP